MNPKLYTRLRKRHFLHETKRPLSDFELLNHDYSRVGGGKHKFIVRKETMDEYIVKEVAGYAVVDVKGHRVLDIGANIGAYSVLAAQLGAEAVLGVEPEEENCRMFEANTARYVENVMLMETAAVSQLMININLFPSPGKNKGAHSLYVRGGRLPITVGATWIQSVYNMFKPTTIKLDCEGAEHALFLHGPPIPESVTQVIMEIHLNKKQWRRQAPLLIALFDEWECVRPPVITSKNWHTIGAWTR